MHRHLRRATVAAVLVAVAALAGCSSGSGASDALGSSGTTATTSGAVSSCAPVVHEPLDSDLGHVLPGSPEPRYLTDPPTSGRHAPGVAPVGVLTTPLSRPDQVGALEAGEVLIQYRDSADLDALRSLAAGQVVVAPNPDLADRVVATAWLTKQVCTGPDVATLAQFGADHAGHGPGTDG